MDGVSDPEKPPPFIRLRPPGAAGPIVIAVPHAGRFYPPEIDAARAVGWSTLRELEDRYADRLIGGAVAGGAVAIVATHARAWIDLNRDEGDHTDTPTSPHGRAGLGLVPQRLAGRALWRRPPERSAIEARVAAIHRPYHAAVAAALAAARADHGHALLIDCHSMPPIASGAARGAGLVIGDRHGASAGPAIVERLLQLATASGLSARLNVPYAGAYGIARHGRPAEQIHAVQLEFDRSLYLDPGLREPGVGVERTSLFLAQMCATAAGALSGEQPRLAAE